MRRRQHQRFLVHPSLHFFEVLLAVDVVGRVPSVLEQPVDLIMRVGTGRFLEW
jgi:hypothetical protein